MAKPKTLRKDCRAHSLTIIPLSGHSTATGFKYLIFTRIYTIKLIKYLFYIFVAFLAKQPGQNLCCIF